MVTFDLTNPVNDYVRIAPNLDSDGNLDVDLDANSLVENAADGIEIDAVEIERVDRQHGRRQRHRNGLRRSRRGGSSNA